MALFSALFGRRDKPKQFQQYAPQQMQALQQLFQGLSGQGGPFGQTFGEFDPNTTQNAFQQGFVEPSMQNFRQRVIPQIMQSFGDQGPSSALYNSLATAGENLQTNLGGQLAQMLQQARFQQMQNQMGGLSSLLGSSPYQTYIQQGSAGLLPSLLSSFASGGGQALGTRMFSR